MKRRWKSSLAILVLLFVVATAAWLIADHIAKQRIEQDAGMWRQWMGELWRSKSVMSPTASPASRPEN
jgi:ABC-type cobalt transport system substrate-binding protein